MIEIIGEEGTSEYRAAVGIAEALKETFKGIEDSPATEELIKIVASAKLSGYQISDIDVVICGVFNKNRFFNPSRLVKDNNGRRVVNKPIRVCNLVAAIEVKDHDESGVVINGDNILVKYQRGPKKGIKSATDQNIKQLHALSGYMSDWGADLFVHRALFMTSLRRIRISGAFGLDFTGSDFLSSLAASSNVLMNNGRPIFKSGEDWAIRKALSAPLFTKVMPTALDRRKMDLITTKTDEIEELVKHLGKKLICLRGYGGTGKTVMLLQAAWRFFQESGQRSIFLTYNHALSADIRRSLTLLRIPSAVDSGGIAVSTVMSFVYRWLLALGVIEHNESEFISHYEKHCTAALELLSERAITISDIRDVMDSNSDMFDFDLVFIDESQDWPQEEAELIKRLYGNENICIADGVDQLTRGTRTKWSKGVSQQQTKLISLSTCLRMKRNLSLFLNKIADSVSLPWIMEPNELAGGGRVIISEHPYMKNASLHHDLTLRAKEKGNAEIDFLICVPPSNVYQFEFRKKSKLGSELIDEGFQVWDGVDDISRKDFPRKKEQYRVIQYSSVRGLEGWTVVLESLDEFWQACFEKRKETGLSESQEIAFQDIDSVARDHAWRQVMIALSRPIDTLVITLKNPKSEFSQHLLKAVRNVSDFIEYSN